MLRPGWRGAVLAAEALCLAGAAIGGALAAAQRMGDYDDDGIVETADMFDFARAYRNRDDARSARAADLNRDGRADEIDVFLFLREWNADRSKALGEP